MMKGPTLEKAITELYCSVELTNIHHELIVLSTLNIFLSITAFLGEHSNLLGSTQEKFHFTKYVNEFNTTVLCSG